MSCTHCLSQNEKAQAEKAVKNKKTFKNRTKHTKCDHVINLDIDE